MKDYDKFLKKAQEQYADKDFEGSVYWYTRCISLRPDDAELYAERGVAHFHLNKLEDSLADMNRAQELEPERSYRYSSRAYIRDAMGDTAGAVEDYKTAVKLDPQDAIAYNNLGLLEEKLGRHTQARIFFDFADALAKEDSQTPAGAPTEYPTNIQSEINRERRSEDRSVLGEMSAVFKSKKTFKEFLTFIRNGFK